MVKLILKSVRVYALCVYEYVFVNLMHCGNKIRNQDSATAKMEHRSMLFRSYLLT